MIGQLRRIDLSLLLAGIVAAWLGASEAYAANQSAVDLVRETTEKLIARISDPSANLRENKEKLYAFVDEQVAPHFDFEHFAKIISARYWRDTSSEQKSKLQDAVRVRLVRTIATGLSQYTEQTISFLPERGGEPEGKATVRMEIRQPTGAVLQLGYRLYDASGTWRIYDVMLDGLSMATTYRTQLADHVRRKGMDSFISVIADQ